jgi:hypothetical protein
MNEKDIPETPVNPVNTSFTDSDNSKIDDIKNILNIPMENVSEKSDNMTFDNEDPFDGNAPDDSFDELGIDDLLDEDGEGMDSLFEDTEALSEMCVELLDLGMNYTSQAISTEWGEDEKYSIPESRKRKLRKPLAKLLQKRAPKVSPELAFMVFAIAIYSPQLIKAYQVRREKLKENTPPSPAPMQVVRNEDPQASVFKPPIEDDESDEYESILQDMRNKSVQSEIKPIKNEKPKRKAGRPKGAKDKSKRKTKVIKSERKTKKTS